MSRTHVRFTGTGNLLSSIYASCHRVRSWCAMYRMARRYPARRAAVRSSRNPGVEGAARHLSYRDEGGLVGMPQVGSVSTPLNSAYRSRRLRRTARRPVRTRGAVDLRAGGDPRAVRLVAQPPAPYAWLAGACDGPSLIRISNVRLSPDELVRCSVRHHRADDCHQRHCQLVPASLSAWPRRQRRPGFAGPKLLSGNLASCLAPLRHLRCC